jgi:hypothetical protein
MLPAKDVKKYWKERAIKLQETAVGYGDQGKVNQDLFYKERTNFLFSYIKHPYLTMDYGCGIGRYANCFENYIGVDMTAELLVIAKKNNPDKMFYHLMEKPFINKHFMSPIGRIFTATVLQHCNTDLCLKIMKGWNNFVPSVEEICMYENSMDFQKPHVTGRTSGNYIEMLSDVGYIIKYSESHTHTVKGEQHTLTIAKV